MTGDEHYAEAERLLDQAAEVYHDDPEAASYLVAAANVHALLAVAGSAVMEVEVVNANRN